jgi:hypothetical protein
MKVFNSDNGIAESVDRYARLESQEILGMGVFSISLDDWDLGRILLEYPWGKLESSSEIASSEQSFLFSR